MLHLVTRRGGACSRVVLKHPFLFNLCSPNDTRDAVLVAATLCDRWLQHSRVLHGGAVMERNWPELLALPQAWSRALLFVAGDRHCGGRLGAGLHSVRDLLPKASFPKRLSVAGGTVRHVSAERASHHLRARPVRVAHSLPSSAGSSLLMGVSLLSTRHHYTLYD